MQSFPRWFGLGIGRLSAVPGHNLLNASAILACEGHTSLTRYGVYLMRERLLSGTDHTHPVIDCILSEAGSRHYSTFIDIGANVGTITRAVSHYFKSCIAIEPSAAHFSRLNKVISGLPNCLAINCALGDERGSTYVYLSGTDPGDNTVFPRRGLIRGESQNRHLRLHTQRYGGERTILHQDRRTGLRIICHERGERDFERNAFSHKRILAMGTGSCRIEREDIH